MDTSHPRPNKKLYIAERGKGPLSLFGPPSELVTEVFDENGNVAYTSIKDGKHCRKVILSHPKLGSLISTTYPWGRPRHDPMLEFLQGQRRSSTVSVRRKVTSKTTNFTLPDGRTFEWSYSHSRGINQQKVNLLTLREQATGQILAQLLRGEGTRPEGTSRSSTGNGGQLMLDGGAPRYLDEALILATCLMMLKRESDRRRGLQAATLV